MSWSDQEIDKVFKENADANSFEYKEAYWNEMEALLPKSGGKDFLWMFTSFAFIGLLLTAGVVGENRMATINEGQATLIAERSIEMSDEFRNTQDSKITNSSIEENLPGIIGRENDSKEDETEFINRGTENENLLQNDKLSIFEVDLIDQTIPANSEELNNPSINKKVSGLNNNISSDKERLANILALDLMVVSPIGALAPKPHGNVEGEYVNKSILSSQLPIVAPIKPIQTKFYIAALGGVSQSMITPSSKVSSSLGLGAGLQLRKGSFLFNVGLNGTVCIHNDIVLSRESKVYGFGSTYYRSELKYNHIYSLEGDFSVGYQLRKSIFSIGIRPSYVVGTKVGMRMQENESEFVQEKHYGYLEGINRLGLKPMIGYAYKFGAGLSLGINLGVQLTPLVMDEYVNGMSNKFPIDGQLILKKSLNFKK